MNVLCKVLGHAPVTDTYSHQIRQCHCKRCKAPMIGTYMQNASTKEWYWVYNPIHYQPQQH
ncbi:hypothetical protein [Spirosoma gilvum]